MKFLPAVIAAVNNESVLQTNLLASPILKESGVSVILQRDYPSASLAYNAAMAKAQSDILIFVHQDVYIPQGWQESLSKALHELENQLWGVLGVVGKTRDNRVAGRAWSTGLQREVGCRIDNPAAVESVDELLLVVNKKSGLVFDDKLPGFHLYGTDIIQSAGQKGFRSFVIDAPVIHNSVPYKKIDPGFVEAYRYLQNKWRDSLPIRTLVTTLTRHGWPLRIRRIRQMFRNHSRTIYKRLDDPQVKARELGYEH